ncbi:PLD nuclease N-terminal domain-containing protein [Streptomyces sp. 4N509B]|uniref:PLD nuclease N-terminal domain-containing protein n=1 Tax=Streptomyces sp. 4N509B TaxID=3457413 RepID=UPI003FD5CB97
MLLILLPLALAVYALVDCVTTKDEDVKHLPKVAWIFLIVLATVIGPLAWIFAGRERARRTPGGRRGGGGWVAPDDNPEFLASLGGSGTADTDRDRDDARGQSEEELLREWEAELRNPKRSERSEKKDRKDRRDRKDHEDGSSADESPEAQREEERQQERQQEGRERGGDDDPGGSGPDDSPGSSR